LNEIPLATYQLSDDLQGRIMTAVSRSRTVTRAFALLTIFGFVAGLLFTAGNLRSQSKLRVPPTMLAQDSLKVWIRFADKGETTATPTHKAAISAAALHRRALRATNADAVNLDREVNPAYIDQVRAHALRVVHASRWLNAVSAYVTPAQLGDLAQLDCVSEIRPVARFTRPEEPISPASGELLRPTIPYPVFYGPSYAQLNLIQVPLLHDLGYTGAGIRILMLDTGFNTEHSAFLATDIEATWDFINNDEDVVDAASAGDGQQAHGTATLSLIGASEDEKSIGAAYEATFLLAKTEIYGSETAIEEDNWVAGIEWGESLGADVASSSLGYIDWYEYADLDGNTTLCTQAADIAASLGVIVVSAIGNGQRTSTFPTLIAPSDGDSVITVGAVSNGGDIAFFSSNGPTADGRIKPDVCAQGTSNYIASHVGGYGLGQGTSYSTPLVAGAVALLLQAHPEWQYGNLYRALTLTATRAAAPDNVYGYGIVRALEALNYDGSAPSFIKGVTAYPNPFTDFVEFDFEIPPAGAVEIRIYTVAGEKIATLTRPASDPLPLKWQGRNDSGEDAAPGIYIAYISAPGLSETRKILKTR